MFLTEAAAARERGEIPEGDFTEVFVTTSDEAVPLPDNVFDGERDLRWKLNETRGVFERIA